MSQYERNIRPHVESELESARRAAARRDFGGEFAHLERAHVLSQGSTRLHVRVHWCMLVWALRQRRGREFFGQLFRLTGAATKTFIGLVPTGNTGGTNVSPFQPMPIDPELAELIARAKRTLP